MLFIRRGRAESSNRIMLAVIFQSLNNWKAKILTNGKEKHKGIMENYDNKCCNNNYKL